MLQYIYSGPGITLDNQLGTHGNSSFIYRRDNADQNMRIMNMVNEMLFDLVKEKFIDKLKEITHDFRGMVLREGKDDNERLMKIR